MTETAGATQPVAPKPGEPVGGVDVTLIHWMLSLTPTQRLDVLEHHLRDVLALRAARKS